jgi:hypothetical protein
MKLLSISMLALLASSYAFAKPPHPCAADARAKAQNLLSMHVSDDDIRGSIDDKVVRRAPIRALKGKGKFDVLEVMGYVYKAQYRIRLIYAQIPDSCLLMGQEVIEIANPY